MVNYRTDKPYWLQLCKWGEKLEGQRQFSPSAGSDRLHGELLVGIIDRLRELGISTHAVTEEFDYVADWLRQYILPLDDEVRKIVALPHLSSDDVERLALIAALKQRVQNLAQFARLLNSCPNTQFEELRERSLYLFSDLMSIYQLADLLEMDGAELQLAFERLRQGLRQLSVNLSDMLLACYTDFFDDFTPTDLSHLGAVLQCAAILDRICDVEMNVTEGIQLRSNTGHIYYPGRMYRDLLNWFQDAHHYSDEPVFVGDALSPF
jgi:hypothetical protein